MEKACFVLENVQIDFKTQSLFGRDSTSVQFNVKMVYIHMILQLQFFVLFLNFLSLDSFLRVK